MQEEIKKTQPLIPEAVKSDVLMFSELDPETQKRIIIHAKELMNDEILQYIFSEQFQITKDEILFKVESEKDLLAHRFTLRGIALPKERIEQLASWNQSKDPVQNPYSIID